MTISESTTGRGAFDVDFATGTVHLDETYARTLGLADASSETLARWLARFHPDDEPVVRAALNACECPAWSVADAGVTATALVV